jgi:hypothetical protein
VKNPGRVATRLAKILQDAGVPIPDATCFWIQQGGYRHRNWDLARWGADWKVGHQYWTLYSWSTMTACVRYGIVLDYDEPTEVEVFSNVSQADIDAKNAKWKQKQLDLQAKIEERAKRNRERAEERRKREQERFRVFRCNTCGGQFPWNWPEEKRCGCGSTDIRDVSVDVLFGYEE